MNDLFILAGLVILIVVGIRVLWLSFHTNSPEKNWLTVEGVVYVCRIDTHRDNNGEEYFEPRIKCLYKVKGVSYILTLDGPDFWSCSQREWENVACYYPSGCTVVVQYDPIKPQRAYVAPIVNSSAG
jgi:hypothetical protein